MIKNIEYVKKTNEKKRKLKHKTYFHVIAVDLSYGCHGKSVSKVVVVAAVMVTIFVM